MSLRQGVLTAAGNLATSFNTTANNLTQQQTSLDLSVVQAVGQINQLTQQIAHLNQQVSNLQNVGESAGTFVDQRQQAIDQLSALVDVSVFPSRQHANPHHRKRYSAGERAAKLPARRRRSTLPDCTTFIPRGTTSPAKLLPGS